MADHLTDSCIFCKIIRGDLPSYAFLDINPLSDGHALVIPKYHAEFFHQLPEDHLADILPLAKKIAVASGLDQYNLLQNNGPMAHQVVKHVHFHIIPKPNAEEGLGVGWPQKQVEKEDFAIILSKIKEKL
ncbi:HIT-like protein [Hesseltinella vesiculosa]|uniref:HIT-like protein n=1 Tax=Hesseltinella vesiculosa TaxID=101127 RepID=A0A1X2GMB8_9FUNG|nr:HIT-like protein [Hesseltinella vesiculosa]